ncbi:hypothetical protein AB0L05_36805 [Nonomuraea pusilla]|uniref:hypothetical protein n=1 Tax=Nonomuraea pusilla TaxID=46177 RepID=UPI003329039C
MPEPRRPFSWKPRPGDRPPLAAVAVLLAAVTSVPVRGRAAAPPSPCGRRSRYAACRPVPRSPGCRPLARPVPAGVPAAAVLVGTVGAVAGPGAVVAVAVVRRRRGGGVGEW